MQLNHSDKDKTTKEWNITAFFKLTLSVLPFPNVSTWLHSQGTHLIWEILSLCAVLLPLPSVSQLGTTVAGKHPLTHFFNSFSNPITPQNVRRDWNHFLLLTIIQNTEKKNMIVNIWFPFWLHWNSSGAGMRPPHHPLRLRLTDADQIHC